MANKLWQIKEPDPASVKALCSAIKIHPIVAKLLINRKIIGIDEAANFLNGSLEQLHDPHLLKGMGKLIERIKQARDKRERVLIFGDYDVDGVTSSALLNRALKKLGIDVLHHIPDRQLNGYGLNHEIAAYAQSNNIKLIITVDCGITALAEVDSINQLGIDVCIVDHHEPPHGRLPKAVAIINPKQSDCPYPFKELASVGLVAKISQALAGKLDKDLLDLVALGTIADVVVLNGENRIFVKEGLPRILKTKNIGLKALVESAKIKDKQLSPYHVGFILGPRINAAGRMASARKSLDLFLSEDRQEAAGIAAQLEQYNSQRQKMQRDIIQEALAIVDQEVNFNKERVIVLSREGWHKGVLGIVASRITETYYRPSIVISTENGIGTASARSIDGFHLHQALTSCASCLENFGGHEGAAGLTIKAENIDPFRELINAFADSYLDPSNLVPVIAIDCAIALSDISLELVSLLDQLEPYGEGNPEPLFCTNNLLVKSAPQIMGRETMKFYVSDGKTVLSAIGFGMAKFKDMIRPGQKIDLAYQLIVDDWNKAPVPQLKLKEIRLSG